MKNADTAVDYVIYLDSFALSLKVEGLRPHTISCYLRDVRRLGECSGWVTPASLTAKHVRNYIEWLSGRVAAPTVTSAQLGIRRFFRFLIDEGEIKSDPSAKIKLVRFRVAPQPTYSPSEISQIVRTCDLSTANGVRDRAIITVLFDTGVRVGELVSMGMPDWVSHTATVDGKTGVRVVPLGDTAFAEIQRYQRRWKLSDSYLWRGKKGKLNESGVFQMVRRVCVKAGVEFKGVHAFRRAAAAQMKRLGMNDSDIIEVLGWKDVTMLRRYTATVAGELAQAAHSRFSPADAL
jgi:site-specific recombinase XerD